LYQELKLKLELGQIFTIFTNKQVFQLKSNTHLFSHTSPYKIQFYLIRIPPALGKFTY